MLMAKTLNPLSAYPSVVITNGPPLETNTGISTQYFEMALKSSTIKCIRSFRTPLLPLMSLGLRLTIINTPEVGGNICRAPWVGAKAGTTMDGQIHLLPEPLQATRTLDTLDNMIFLIKTAVR